MGKNKFQSEVWKYFTKYQDKNEVKCNTCDKIFKNTCSTGTLWAHQESKHSIDEEPKRKIPKMDSNQGKITAFVRPSIEEEVSKMAAKDGLTLRQISKSEFIQKSLMLFKGLF